MKPSTHLAASVAELFPATRQQATVSIGVEHELLTRDLRDGSVPAIERIRSASAGAAYEPFLAFEPGGQVELSLPAAGSVDELDRVFRNGVDELRRRCRQIGIELDHAPVDPLRSVDQVQLQLRRPRYLAMQERFDRVGPDGRKMMRLTASTQLCLDWWPGAAGLEQWRVANLAGPGLAAALAHGELSRLAIWLGVDPTRTAFDGRLLVGDPIEAYTDFAHHAVPFGMPQGRTSERIEHHLSTLFPPVRPRGRYLEVRYLDVQPEHRIAPIAEALRTMLYDDEIRRIVLARLDGPGVADLMDERWHRAADRDPDLVADGLDLLALAGSDSRLELAS